MLKCESLYMRILLLVPLHKINEGKIIDDKIWKETGLPYFQAHNFWYKALKTLGHDVKLFIYSGQSLRLDYYSFVLDTFARKFKLPYRPLASVCQAVFSSIHRKQKEILDLASLFKPQLLILSGNTNSVLPQTLLEIKKIYKSKLVLLSGVAPVVFATKSERQMAPFFDRIFTNDMYHALDWQMLGAKHARALPISAIDPQIHKIYPLTDNEKKTLGSDVSFVGRFTPLELYRNRVDYLESLSGFNLKIWTYDKDVILSYPKLKRFFAGQASGEKMFKIFSASKININIQANFMLHGGNLRTFEIPGCGGFELVDRVDQNWFLEGKEIITLKSPDDLIKKIKYYLTHSSQRLRIAKNGYIRTHKEHTYQHRFEQLIETIT